MSTEQSNHSVEKKKLPKCDTDKNSVYYNRGKRATICALLVGEEVRFGVSRSHILDSKVWNKKKGRCISYGRAVDNAFYTMPVPTEKIKATVVNKAKELAYNLTVTGKSGRTLTEDEIMEKLTKRRKFYEREQTALDSKFTRLVEVTTKVHEFFHPVVEKPRVEKVESIDEVKSFHELVN